MADTELRDDAELHLIDGKTGERIDPSHLRMALSGDVFLTHDLSQMPAQHVDVEITLVGKVSFPVTLKETKEAGVAAVFTVKADRQTSWRVLPKAKDPDLFDEDDWRDVIEIVSRGDHEWGTEQIGAAARYARDELGWSPERFGVLFLGRTFDATVDPWAIVHIAAKI